jgi:hypothetical protein
MTPITDTDRKPTDLHIDVTFPAPAMRMRHSLQMREEQDALNDDLRTFVAEWLQRLKSPAVDAKQWPKSRLEVLSDETVRYIDRLEAIAREAAEQVEDEVLAARIEKLLDSRA